MSIVEQESYEEYLRLLRKSLRSPEEFRFVLATVDHGWTINKLENDLKAAFPERPFLRYRIGEADYAELIDTLFAAEGILLIEDFDTLVERKDLYVGFNQRRDRVAGQPLQLICCLARYDNPLRKVARTVRDWWSLRTLIVRLTSEVPRSAEVISRSAGVEAVNNAPGRHDLEVERLRKRLAEIDGEAEPRLYRSLVRQLHARFRRLGWFQDILDLLLPHKEAANKHDESWLAWLSKNIGRAAFLTGDNNLARENYALADQYYTKTGDERGSARISDDLGELAFRLGNNDQAREYFLQADQGYQKTGNDQGRANVARSLGKLELHLGNDDQAREYFMQADQGYQRTGNELGRANVASNLGTLELRLGNNNKAREHFNRANERYLKTGNELGSAGVAYSLGTLEFRLENNDQAREYFNRASQGYQKTGSSHGRANVARYFGQLELRLKNYDQATHYFQQAKESYQRVGMTEDEGHANHFLALVERNRKQLKVAILHWQEALKLYRRVNFLRNIVKTLLYLVETSQAENTLAEERTAWLQEAGELIEQHGLDDLRPKYERLREELGEG